MEDYIKRHLAFVGCLIAALAIYGGILYHQYSKGDMVAYVAPSPSPLPTGLQIYDGGTTNNITASIDTSGNLTVSGTASSGDISVGSSTYGPTSATVNGSMEVLQNSTWNGSAAVTVDDDTQ